MSCQEVLHPSLSAVQMNKMRVLQFYVFGCAMLGSLVATLATKEALDPNKFSPRAFLVRIASWIYFNLHWNL